MLLQVLLFKVNLLILLIYFINKPYTLGSVSNSIIL
jgi:hypothetical protein